MAARPEKVTPTATRSRTGWNTRFHDRPHGDPISEQKCTAFLPSPRGSGSPERLVCRHYAMRTLGARRQPAIIRFQAALQNK